MLVLLVLVLVMVRLLSRLAAVLAVSTVREPSTAAACGSISLRIDQPARAYVRPSRVCVRVRVSVRVCPFDQEKIKSFNSTETTSLSLSVHRCFNQVHNNTRKDHQTAAFEPSSSTNPKLEQQLSTALCLAV